MTVVLMRQAIFDGRYDLLRTSVCTENLVRFDSTTESLTSAAMVALIFFLLNVGASFFQA
jgi:hypothetical protein